LISMGTCSRTVQMIHTTMMIERSRLDGWPTLSVSEL
jgi:hypothetical protein